MKLPTIIAALVIASALAACGEKQNPVKTSGSEPSEITASAPSAPTDRNTPPDSTPPTHAMDPKPEAAWTGLSTAQDTSAQKPMKDLTASEQTYSMPKPGQSDNHSSPSVDADNKAAPASAPAAADPAVVPAK